MSDKPQRLRVLSIDGGGMRGLYSAVYLSTLTQYYAAHRKVDRLDVGKGFDLIVGTSTGAILACMLAKGIPMCRVAKLYQDWGQKIFPRRLPKSIGIDLAWQLYKRPMYIREGSNALKTALVEELGETTIGDIWTSRRIALAIPAVEMSQHRAYVFKTPHLATSKGRDNGYALADVCLATTAAPIYRSMARIKNPDTQRYRVFVDGGLWANNPVLVALIDALDMSDVDDCIEIYCLGSSPRQEGESIGPEDLDRGLHKWKFGGEAVSLSLDSQEFVFNKMASMLSRYVQRSCQIIRFPSVDVPESFMEHLDLDVTSQDSVEALIDLAQASTDETLSRCGNRDDGDGQLLNSLLNELPAYT